VYGLACDAKPQSSAAAMCLSLCQTARQAAGRYGVTSLPAYFFFKKGADHKYKPDQITGEVNPYDPIRTPRPALFPPCTP
jgi:hypothetical protein